MMQLLSLEVKPNGLHGWGFPTHRFGASITQLYGPNGSGKTPTIEFIVFALGHNVVFRSDIYDKCGEAILVCNANGKILTIHRRIRKTDFYAEIFFGETKSVYTNEKDFSEFLLPAFGFSCPPLITSDGKPTPPYMSTFLPLVYLNQDNGYGRFYATTTGSAFIQGQHDEMLRIFFNLHSRNNYENKRRQIDLKNEIEATNKTIVGLQDLTRRLEGEVKGLRVGFLDLELAKLQGELDSLLDAREVKTGAVEALSRAISDQKSQLRSIESHLIELHHRINGTEKIEQEIGAEIETLGLNVEARDVFLSFGEICQNSNCGLFQKSAESYGKSLLYLKDQVKDLESGKIKWRAQIDDLSKEKKSLESEIRSNTNALTKTNESPASIILSDTVSLLTGKIHEVTRLKKQLEIFESEQNRHMALLAKREQLTDEYESFGRSPKMGIKQAEIREAIRQKLVEWMDILDTKNVSRDIALDAAFIPSFGGEPLFQIHGSTKVRLVLAFHAAVFEVQSSVCPELSFPFILDTPKQQEMETAALASYVQSLSELSKKNGTQIVLSTTEYRYACGESDTEWLAGFDGDKQKMYLGPVST